MRLQQNEEEVRAEDRQEEITQDPVDCWGLSF